MIKNAYIITFKMLSSKRTDSLKKKKKEKKNLKHKYNLWKVGTCTSQFLCSKHTAFFYTQTRANVQTHTPFVVISEQVEIKLKKSSL